MRTQALIIITLLFVFSCKSNKMTQKNLNEEHVESVVIAEGNLHGAGEEGIEKQNIVIVNTNDWQELINKMNAMNDVSESFTESEIDFSKYTVIAVFTDVKGSGGHTVTMEISKTSENILVTSNHTSPSGMATTVMTQPYAIVKIPKTDLPIVFE